MQEEDYTFVTLDSDDAILTDAVIVDVDGENDLSDVVMIDESIDVSDFITLSDDTIMLSDADMLDTYSTDIDGSDISFIYIVHFMISVKCPHCHVGLKVDEGKIPLDITSFKCPKCRQPIPVSLLSMEKGSVASESETVLIQPLRMTTGHLSVIANADTPEQTFPLQEGVYIIGRKSKASTATIGIVTADKSMSREHIRIEVKKDAKGGYKHYLSDNNSKNHTLYNSNYLENGEIVVLNNNDEIIIGRTVLRFNE